MLDLGVFRRLDDVGLYDIPALIDFVLLNTGWSQLFYIGFSQGNTAAWITLADRVSYNDKVCPMYSCSVQTTQSARVCIALAAREETNLRTSSS